VSHACEVGGKNRSAPQKFADTVDYITRVATEKQGKPAADAGFNDSRMFK